MEWWRKYVHRFIFWYLQQQHGWGRWVIWVNGAYVAVLSSTEFKMIEAARCLKDQCNEIDLPLKVSVDEAAWRRQRAEWPCE